MTRALLALLLTGCAATPLPHSAIPLPYELVGFDWCSPAELHQCAIIRQGGELLVMGHPSRFGDEGDVWDVRGATVDAFSEDE